MSSPLIKNITGPQIVGGVTIFSDGTTEVKSSLPPQLLCSSLFKVIMNIMFASFQPVEVNKIENPFNNLNN